MNAIKCRHTHKLGSCLSERVSSWQMVTSNSCCWMCHIWIKDCLCLTWTHTLWSLSAREGHCLSLYHNIGHEFKVCKWKTADTPTQRTGVGWKMFYKNIIYCKTSGCTGTSTATTYTIVAIIASYYNITRIAIKATSIVSSGAEHCDYNEPFYHIAI